MARRYEFYFQVTKQYFTNERSDYSLRLLIYLLRARTYYERAITRVSKILFLPRENKIRIFKPLCNVLFII